MMSLRARKFGFACTGRTGPALRSLGLAVGLGLAAAPLSSDPGPAMATGRAVGILSANALIVAQDRRERRGGERQRHEGAARNPDRAIPFIDGHTHILGNTPRGEDYAGAANAALGIMDRYKVVRAVVMPPPFVAGKEGIHDDTELLAVARRHKGRFVVLGGGGSLNVMIHEAVARGTVDDALKARFTARAEKILADGAVGFGEMAALHFSLHPGHPFEMAPPDHPLFLLLAEIAARHRVPIDLHMEAVIAGRDIPVPVRGAPNPTRISANIAAFERLLDHAPDAVIIWDHLGWDNTGERTVALTRRLLKAHPNLMMNFKIGRAKLADNQPLQRGHGLGEEWRSLILEFPDRFFLGSDIKPTPPGDRRAASDETPEGVSHLLDFLPPDLAHKIAIDNPTRIFALE